VQGTNVFKPHSETNKSNDPVLDGVISVTSVIYNTVYVLKCL